MIDAWRHHRVVGNALVGLLVGLFLVLLLTNTSRTGRLVVAIRQTQESNTKINATNADLLQRVAKLSHRVASCTTPGKRCYQHAQRRTASAVGDINQVVILAAACAGGLPPDLSVGQRQTQIQACVIERLARKH